MTAIEYQKRIFKKLKIVFPCQGEEDLVKKEWNIFKGATDGFNPAVRGRIYMPRPDLAVGPFSITPGVRNYTEALSNKDSFFKKLFTIWSAPLKLNRFEG